MNHLKRDVTVSNHAMLRFVERVFLQDMEDLQRRLLPDATIEQWKIGGDGYYPVGDSHVVRIVGGVVVTVLPPGAIAQKKPRYNTPQGGKRAKKLKRRKSRRSSVQ